MLNKTETTNQPKPEVLSFHFTWEYFSLFSFLEIIQFLQIVSA